MRRLPVFAAALMMGACHDAPRALEHRGFIEGMPSSQFRRVAESIGPVECGPFGVAGVTARQLCAASNRTRGLRVAGAIDSAATPVPYIVVQEPDSGGSGLATLIRQWGAPDTLVGTGARWRRGASIADADTATGQLTVWLTDTATAVRIARRLAELQRAASDTLPLRNDLGAVLDTIRVTSPAGAEMPAAAPDVSVKPKVISCRNAAVPPALAARAGSVTLYYVVDTLGHPEPESIRVLEATHRGFVAPARATIGSCSFQPGRQGRRPVRVLVQQRVGFSSK